MEALRRLNSSPSKTAVEEEEQHHHHHHHHHQSTPPPPKSILKKRARSPSPASDADDASASRLSWRPSKRSSSYPRHQQPSSQPEPATTAHYAGTGSSTSRKTRRTPKHDSSVIAATDISSSSPAKQARFDADSAPAIVKCKFAKAGCPFAGSHEQVTAHEVEYCSPLYRQLAHYKMLASRQHTSPQASRSKLLSGRSSDVELSSTFLSINHQDSLLCTASDSTKSPSASNFSSRDGEAGNAEEDALHAQIHRLQTDLARAQSQLEAEKNLRTERLRKASERCLELMSLSELGEGKVEVLSIKLKAERELREKLEEELESLRAERAAHEHQTY